MYVKVKLTGVTFVISFLDHLIAHLSQNLKSKSNQTWKEQYGQFQPG